MEAIETAMTTALTTIQTDAMDMIAKALGPALIIAGAFIVVRLAIRFFTSVAG